MSRKVILSYGGGKDSTALVAIDANRKKVADLLSITESALEEAFPVFEVAVFSDPGAEFQVTYQTIQRVRDLLGDRFVETRRNGENIAEWCTRLGIIPVMPGGAHVCSKKFKGDVLARWAKDQGVTHPVWLIGIEADEGNRIKRFTAPDGDKAEYRYPLVDLGLTRAHLDAILEYLGWPNVHKSSCIFCPYMSEEEIKDLYDNHPNEWAKVVLVEEQFKMASKVKHQAWLDAGQPLTAAKRAPIGMWRKDSWESGVRLFAKKVGGKQLSVQDWQKKFDAERSYP